jgi:hypothetical protein
LITGRGFENAMLAMGGDDQASRRCCVIGHGAGDNQYMCQVLLESSDQRGEAGRISWVLKMAG